MRYFFTDGNSYSRSLAGLFILVFLCGPTMLNAKEKKIAPTTPELYREIAMQDSLMFAAFNRQDLATFKTFFSTDLEWFQDNGGLIQYDSVFYNFENNFKRPEKLTRKLVKGTLEVHPIKKYGAIEIGTHQFKHVENGREETGTFKFLMIWRKLADKWQITRVVSYDH